MNIKKSAIAWFIIAIMALSVLGFVFGGQGSTTSNYNGYKFEKIIMSKIIMMNHIKN